MILKLCVKEVLRFLLRVFYVFRVKSNRVLFESYSGERICCNPFYIYDNIEKIVGSNVEIAWSVKPKCNNEYADIKCVKRFSLSYFKYLMTAKVYITNIGGYDYIPFRKTQIVINTWHAGGAYKKIEKDFYDIGRCQWLYNRSILHFSKATSYFLSSSYSTTKCMSSAWNLHEDKFVKLGLPRNDVFFSAQKMNELSNCIRDRFNIKQSDFVVLYAPTFRNTTSSPSYDWSLKENELLEAVKKRFAAKRVILFLRYHICLFNSLSFNSKMHEYTSTVRDVSDYPEMQDLLCTADMLITDYSSSVWDYSFTYRPCFLFTPDLEEYKKKTDFYTPIEEWGFPICKTNEELRKQIEAFDENKFKQAMIRHHENLGSYEKGTATEEVAKIILSHIDH